MPRLTIASALPIASALFVATAVVTLSSVVSAQNVTTTSTTVNNVAVTGSQAASMSLAPPANTTGNTVNSLNGAHAALPTLNTPAPSDSPSH